MHELKKEEYYPSEIINSLIVATEYGKLFRPKHDYFNPEAEVITGTKFPTLFLRWEYNITKTEHLFFEFIEPLLDASSAVPIHTEKVYSFLLKNLQHVQPQQSSYSFFDSIASTIHDDDNSLTNSLASSSIATIKSLEEDDLSILHDIYIFDYAGEEEVFIHNNYHLVPFLKNAITPIMLICGNDIDVKLHYSRDDEEDFETLFIIIKTSLAADYNISLLDRIDNEWWLNVDYDVRKFLSIDIDS